MDHSLQAINLYSLIESTLFGDVFYDAEIQLRLGSIWVGFLDLLGFLFRTNRRHNRMAMLKKNIKDVCCDKAAAA